MAYLCLDCFEIYDDEILKTKYDLDCDIYCPKKKCSGYVVEVDELLILPIKFLNQKGYITKYSCSGHIYESCPNVYIMFEDDIELPSLPKGFSQDGNCIRKVFDNKLNEIKLFKEINKALEDLLSWVIKLDYMD